MSQAAQLAQGLAALSLQLPAGAESRLLDYLELLQKWNKVYNLTAIREADQMVSRHLLDSLSVLAHISGKRIIDIGSGAGLPGIALAIARPEASVCLLEVNHKKATFLQQAITELGLRNANVVANRVEEFRPATNFDVVISRAFADLSEYVALAGHLCTHDGVIVAMKGLHPFEELSQLPANVVDKKVIRLEVPGLAAERHLVLMTLRAS
ncbi:MAG: 16S rRNA (guanine(527)-N(7))-methyltransferase RsmG [Burkholderiales bacterium]|nr:16S rRNA (guanine(527)-N(7))-methyltransferase RsmG [Burkholderiales bacterium]